MLNLQEEGQWLAYQKGPGDTEWVLCANTARWTVVEAIRHLQAAAIFGQKSYITYPLACPKNALYLTPDGDFQVVTTLDILTV
jgi:hypothetical protein